MPLELDYLRELRNPQHLNTRLPPLARILTTPTLHHLPSMPSFLGYPDSLTSYRTLKRHPKRPISLDPGTFARSGYRWPRLRRVVGYSIITAPLCTAPLLDTLALDDRAAISTPPQPLNHNQTYVLLNLNRTHVRWIETDREGRAEGRISKSAPNGTPEIRGTFSTSMAPPKSEGIFGILKPSQQIANCLLTAQHR